MNIGSKYAIVTAITASIFCTQINASNNVKTTEKTQASNTAQITVAPKKLGFLKMQAVSIGIVAQPSLMVTAWEAKEEAVKILQEIALPDVKPADFVTTRKNRLAIPIDAFLAPFRGYSAIVVPLLKESLGENSMLERLFNSPSSITTKAFFDGEVQTIEKLILMGSEFKVFFSDLEESLSNIAKRRYQTALQARIATKK